MDSEIVRAPPSSTGGPHRLGPRGGVRAAGVQDVVDAVGGEECGVPVEIAGVGAAGVVGAELGEPRGDESAGAARDAGGRGDGGTSRCRDLRAHGYRMTVIVMYLEESRHALGDSRRRGAWQVYCCY